MNKMWNKYIEKDSRIIRPLDGYECVLILSYLNIIDVFPKFSIEDFRKNAQDNLSNIDFFNLSIKIIDKHSFWIRKPFEIFLEEVEYSESEEIENVLQNEYKTLTPLQKVYDKNDEGVIIPFLFKICQLKNNKTKLTFSVIHAMSDGRTIFYMYDLLRKIIKGEKLEKMESQICSFNQLSNFHDLNPSIYEKTPKTWNEINELSILPKISKPIGYITIHSIYDYQPISKFCRENNVTVQAMLIAMATRAARKYNNLNKETPIWIYTPCDARPSKYSTDAFKNRKFFCNAGALFPSVIGQKTLIEDIKYSMEKLLESKKTYDNIAQILMSAQAVDPNTLKYTPPQKMPDFHKQPVVLASNIGRINGNNPLFYASMDCPNEFYNLATHCYHTDDKIYMATIMPINFDKKYWEYLKEEMDLIFKKI